jgi:hypothetical protein
VSPAGVQKGIPSLVVAAASFDDVVAITGYTICKSIALSASGGVSAWAILHGPVDVVAGVSAGCPDGSGCAAIWVSDLRLHRHLGQEVAALRGRLRGGAHACFNGCEGEW